MYLNPALAPFARLPLLPSCVQALLHSLSDFLTCPVCSFGLWILHVLCLPCLPESAYCVFSLFLDWRICIIDMTLYFCPASSCCTWVLSAFAITFCFWFNATFYCLSQFQIPHLQVPGDLKMCILDDINNNSGVCACVHAHVYITRRNKRGVVVSEYPCNTSCQKDICKFKKTSKKQPLALACWVRLPGWWSNSSTITVCLDREVGN